MSFATSDFRDIAQLRFWRGPEIAHRELAQGQIVDLVSRTLEARTSPAALISNGFFVNRP